MHALCLLHHIISLKTQQNLGAIINRAARKTTIHGELPPESAMSINRRDTGIPSQDVKIYEYYGCVVLGSQTPSFVQHTAGYSGRR
jgi:hypothetical protein